MTPVEAGTELGPVTSPAQVGPKQTAPRVDARLVTPSLEVVKPPEHQSFWLWVMCLTGVDYFSTLGYQPSIAFESVGMLAPLATVVLVAVTLGCALPIYRYVAGQSPHGQGSILMLERLLHGWTAKFMVLILLGFAVSAAHAQTTGTISGTVRDSSGAVIPDTAVTVKHVETGFERSVRTDPRGFYRVPAIPVGQYEVRVAFCPPTPESQARFDRRIETLAAWLLERWEAKRREERHDDARAAG